MRNTVYWILSMVGVVGLAALSPLLVLLPLGLAIGGVAGATSMLLISLVVGFDSSKHQEIVLTSVVLCALFAVFSLVAKLAQILRARNLPTFNSTVRSISAHLLTLHLAVQVSLGASLPIPLLLAHGDDRTMSTADLLKTSLLAFIVFIVAAVFSSYFLRHIIPWRAEKPTFSNAVAYVLSVLLGLVASTYAYYGSETVAAANELGRTLVQASIALCTAVATLVGAYIAVVEAKAKAKASTAKD